MQDDWGKNIFLKLIDEEYKIFLSCGPKTQKLSPDLSLDFRKERAAA